MDATPEFVRKYRDQIRRCGRCGFCQAVCPVFGATLRPALNARGKMMILKEVMEGHLELGPELVESLFQCTTCASCATTCPAGVQVPEIIKQARQDMVGLGACHPAFAGMREVLQTHPNIYAEEEIPEFEAPRNQKAAHVFFVGCVGTYREEEATAEALALLNRLKLDYTLIDEVCCSGVLEDVGYALEPRLAQTNIDRVLATGARTLITGCPYCYRTFVHKAAYSTPLQAAGVKVVHLAQFLAGLDLGATTAKRVTYHDPCDLGRHCGIYEEPRQTLRRLAPDFVEMEHHHADALCCGAGGGVRGAYPANSLAMARRRLAEAEATGAEVLVTECNSCIHNLSNAKLRKQKFQILNTAQFINQILAD